MLGGFKVRRGQLFKAILANYWAQRGRPTAGYLLENSAGNPLDFGAFGKRVIRPVLAEHGLPWYGYYGGRRGAATAMAHLVNGDSQTTVPHFGHSKEVADGFYIKGVPEATRAAALSYDGLLSLPEPSEQGTGEGQVEVATAVSK